MNFAFDEAQEELRAAARAFLADHSSPEQVREAMQGELGYDPAVWKRIGAELGWPALLVPEELGGLGLGWIELVALLEVMGEALLCAPFFSSVCLAGNALLLAGDAAQQAEHLPGIAEGRTRASLAFSEANGPAVEKILACYPEARKASAVIPLLHLAQEQHGGWLPRAALDHVAAILDMPRIRVYEVASFYDMFNTEPTGRIQVRVCTTTPCWLCGSDAVVEACRTALGIDIGEIPSPVRPIDYQPPIRRWREVAPGHRVQEWAA